MLLVWVCPLVSVLLAKNCPKWEVTTLGSKYYHWTKDVVLLTNEALCQQPFWSSLAKPCLSVRCISHMFRCISQTQSCGRFKFMNGLNVNWPSVYHLQTNKFTTKQIHVYDLNGFIELGIQDNQERISCEVPGRALKNVSCVRLCHRALRSYL